MVNSKILFGNNIIHKCDYCQNSVVESGTHFCKVKKSINSKGKCPKFTYNPTLRKVTLQTLGDYSTEDFSL
ncbi:MAG: hypothetical protein IJ346_00655 [Clostridia bacterium]|nr:hypothetical protein [Clostridia bacterium]